MHLRPYQTSAIDAAREKIRAGAKRCLVIMPTGGGKTVVASEIIRGAMAKGSRTLFVAHRRELIQQTCDKLRRFGVEHGVIMAGIRPALQHQVQVASVQTLAQREGLLERVDLVFVDEAHHLTARNQYSKVLARWPGARVVGLTATPWRLDGQGLSDVFDAHVVATTPRQLRDEGFLTPVGGWEYEAIDTERARVQQGDFVAKDLEESATSRRVVGDIVSEWLLHAAGKRTVLFTVTVAQSQLMVQAFREAGVPAEHVDGTMPAAERDAILRRLRAGETLVVSNCNVLTEGFDCPQLEVCVLARPTLSTSLFLQMVGRVLRPVCFDCGEATSALAASCSCGSTNIKRLARIHDHAGCLAAHGHPFAERDWSPEVASRGARKGKGGAARTLRCSACNSATSRWPCDACGFAPEPKELQIEYEPAAARKEIAADGAPSPKKKKSTDEERFSWWARRFADDPERRARWKYFNELVQRHGSVGKAAHIYFWVSGKKEKVPPEWRAHLLQGAGAERVGAGP